MRAVFLLIGVLLTATVLWDAFETLVMPRTVARRFRISRAYFVGTWRPWARMASGIRPDGRRERFLAVYGPLSLLGLIGVWAVGLVLSFGTLMWSAGASLSLDAGTARFDDAIYMSGTTFFTLGLGDIKPVGAIARLITVIEAGTGFGFLALVISYFPVLYQTFSRREIRLTLLDAWAGSPPAAGEVLRRLADAGEVQALEPFLRDWEYWCSELLEGHISYPIVAYFRSQHQRQSWVSALTAVLDLSALGIIGIDGVSKWQARATFAIARHAAVDLAQVLHAVPDATIDRLSRDGLERLRAQLESVGVRLARSPDADAQLLKLRQSYEPFVAGLGALLLMPLPSWSHDRLARDNWQTSPRVEGGAHL